MSSESVRVNKDIIERVEQVLQAAYEENKEFNEEFNGVTPVAIPSLDPDRGPDGHKLEASEVLFWADRDAYNDELTHWENASTQEAHRDAVKLISDTRQVPIFSDLVAAITRHRVVPFVGAGISQSCKFPLWGKALEEIAVRIDTVDKGAFGAALAAHDHIEAAQLLWDADDTQVRNYIRNTFDKSLCTPDKITGAVKLLPRISQGCVITTNFDNVIESVMGPFEGYMHGVQPGNKFVPKLIKGDRCILKLHGDAEDPTTYIFTRRQYTDGYGAPFNFSKPLPRALRQIFIGQSLLFLGCSLEQDKTLELFLHVKTEGLSRGEHFEIPDHFAILPAPTVPAVRNQKEARLSNLNIRSLWYPDEKHEFVEKILQLAVATIDGRIKPF